jgi:hypothetical protein
LQRLNAQPARRHWLDPVVVLNHVLCGAFLAAGAADGFIV